MPRVIGIDPGTITIDLCGLDDGRLFLDESIRTADALADPAGFAARLAAAVPLDLVAGTSGYGLPCIRGPEITESDLKLAFLAAEGETGGIGGLRALARTLARSPLPLVFTPGVVHLSTVPAHRKVNRVDMGTADKVSAAALAIARQAARRRIKPAETSFVLLELGGAFSAALAVQGGAIVDGAGGSSGPLGVRAAGALDGEVAFLAGRVTKSHIFTGGAATVAGEPDAGLGTLALADTPPRRVAFEAFLESAVKSVAAMLVSVPDAAEVVLSGRGADDPATRAAMERRLARLREGLTVVPLRGVADVATAAAEGAAVLADGLAGGSCADVVESLRLREAGGTVLDHLHVISPGEAARRLGLA